jgi:thiol-disulfide isomerase/thioredoxin
MNRKQEIFAFLLSIIIIFISCSKKVYSPPSQLTVVNGELMMIGPIQYQDVLDQFPAWKNADDEAEIKTEVVDGFKEIQIPLDIQCFIGTWCSDSREGVPSFMKTYRTAENKNIHVELIGVNRKKDDPDHLAPKSNINRVPTFIVISGGVELFRMIEFPESTFENDLISELAEK